MGDFKSFKDESKSDFGTDKDEQLSIAQIQLGAVLRMADSMEAMAKNHVNLQDSLDYYKRRSSRLLDQLETSERSKSELKGHITRLKNRIEDLSNEG